MIETIADAFTWFRDTPDLPLAFKMILFVVIEGLLALGCVWVWLRYLSGRRK